MKKLSKLDVFILICLALGCVLGFAMWVTEAIVGAEVLWLRVSASIIMLVAITNSMYCYATDVASKIVEWFRSRKRSKNK